MQTEKSIKFSGPAHYKITVRGKMTCEFLNIFNALKISSEENLENGICNTTLEGRIQDQAELAGIMNTLYEWRYPILLVEYEDEIQKEL